MRDIKSTPQDTATHGTALMVPMTVIAVSAASGTFSDSLSCVVRDETTFDVGIRDQRDRLTEQHAQEGDTHRGSTKRRAYSPPCGLQAILTPASIALLT